MTRAILHKAIKFAATTSVSSAAGRYDIPRATLIYNIDKVKQLKSNKFNRQDQIDLAYLLK